MLKQLQVEPAWRHLASGTDVESARRELPVRPVAGLADDDLVRADPVPRLLGACGTETDADGDNDRQGQRPDSHRRPQ